MASEEVGRARGRAGGRERERTTDPKRVA
jgi:hypothetical protein